MRADDITIVEFLACAGTVRGHGRKKRGIQPPWHTESRSNHKNRGGVTAKRREGKVLQEENLGREGAETVDVERAEKF